MAIVYVVRHGETEENVSCTVQGHLPGKLTEKGRSQVAKLADRLRGERFDCIYSSDLARARDTALAISAHHACEVVYSEALRERSFGDLEGRPWGAIEEELVRSGKGWHEYRPPGGESWEDLSLRAIDALHAIVQLDDERKILVSAHGGLNRVIYGYFLGVPVRNLQGIQMSNTSLSIYQTSSRSGRLVMDSAHLLNCCAHLD